MEVNGEAAGEEVQQQTSASSDLNKKKNATDEIFCALESSLKTLHAVVNKELDLAKAKRQIGAAVRQTAASPVFRDVEVNLRNLRRFGSSVAREVKKLQSLQNTHPEPSDRPNHVLQDETSKIVVLYKAVASLRSVRDVLLSKQREVSLKFAPLQKEVNETVAAIDTSLREAFNRAQVRVEANELNVQKELAKLKADVGGTLSILQSIPDVLPLLNDKKTNLEKAAGLYTRFANAQEMAQKTREALAHLEMEKYAVSPEKVAQIRNALENLDLVIKEEQADQGDIGPTQTEEPADQPNESGVSHRPGVQAM